MYVEGPDDKGHSILVIRHLRDKYNYERKDLMLVSSMADAVRLATA